MSKPEFEQNLDDILDSGLFKSLSEPVRIEILKYLAINGPRDVSSVADNFPQDRSVISRHMQQMLDAGILVSEKQNRHIIYRVNGKAFVSKLESMTKAIKALIQCKCTDSMK